MSKIDATLLKIRKFDWSNVLIIYPFLYAFSSIFFYFREKNTFILRIPHSSVQYTYSTVQSLRLGLRSIVLLCTTTRFVYTRIGR